MNEMTEFKSSCEPRQNAVSLTIGRPTSDTPKLHIKFGQYLIQSLSQQKDHGNTVTLCFDCASLHRTRHSGHINVLFYCLQDCGLDNTRSFPDNATSFQTFPDLSPSLPQISELSNVQQRVMKTLRWMKTVVLCIIIFAVKPTTSYFTSFVVQSRSPLCSLPLITTMIPTCCAIPLPFSPTKQGVHAPRYSDLVNLQTRFEPIIQDAGLGLRLAMVVQDSEMAFRDLRASIKHSDLAAKETLVAYLNEYVSSATEVAERLTELNSKVGGTMDSILAMDEYTIKSLEAIIQEEKSWNVLNSVLCPFSSPVVTREKLMVTFNEAAGLMDANLIRLIKTVMATKAGLDSLISQQDVINEIVARENVDIMLQEEVMLEKFGTNVLGLNRRKLARFKSHLALLSEVTTRIKAAAKEVGRILLHLNQLSHDLKVLRDNVAMRTNEEGAKIPIEVHIATLRTGVKRLNEGRRIAKERESAILKRLLDGSQYPELGSGESKQNT